ncbi:MAG: 50S ribosomal protein L19e [Nanoarchaeota archaeon]|nr:50S ribosomal protein L19e [Nanoarchaeota archaeon]
MKLNTQKRIAADVLGCSANRVTLDEERLDEIKEAITKTDIRSLIKDKAIKMKPIAGTSKSRTRHVKNQKKKGLRSGYGKRKGKATARLPKKIKWMAKIRTQRKFIKELKEKGIVETKEYSELRLKSKGGFFRSKRHIKIFLNKMKGKNE